MSSPFGSSRFDKWMLAGRGAGPSPPLRQPPTASTNHSPAQDGSFLPATDPAILAALPAAIYTTDAQGRITYFNEAAAALWGCRPELGESEFCGSWKLYWPDGTQLPHAECPMALTLKQRRPIRGMEAIAERPDGTCVPLIPYPTPLFDASGELIGAINMLVDITERKQTEMRLRESEARYRGIFENARVAVWAEDFSSVAALLDEIRAEGVTDLRAYFRGRPARLVEAIRRVRLVDVNDFTVELFEASDKAALLGSLADIFLPETEPVFVEELVTLWEGKRRFEGETVLRTLKGRHIDVAFTIAFEGERFERSLIIILDISAKKAVALDNARLLKAAKDEVAQRRRAEDDLADMFENGAVAMHCVGPDGTILRANLRELEMMGYSRDEYVGRHISEFHVSQAAIDDILKRLSERETVSNYEAQLRCKDGSVRDVLIDSSALWETGNFVHTRCFTTDITERKRAEVALQQLASVIETADDAIIGTNLTGIVTSWNKGAQQLFGYAAEEMVGRSITVIIPEDRHKEEPEILRRIRHAEPVQHYETIRRRKDGRLVDVSLRVSPIKDQNGRIIGASKIARDITERKQAQARQELLSREIHHRTKNLFAVVHAVVARSFAGKETVKDAEAAVLSRLHSLAETHVMLVHTEWQGADLAEIARTEMSPYAGRVTLEGPDVNLAPKTAQNFALAIHELATNAAKYGALSNATGQVHITWSVSESNGHGHFTFRWQERGGPSVTTPTRKGFGSIVLERIMAEHCDVSPRVRFAASGLIYDLSGALDAITTGDRADFAAGGADERS